MENELPSTNLPFSFNCGGKILDNKGNIVGPGFSQKHTINKEIIQKLNLEPTDLCMGNSFVNNVTVYLYKETVLMGRCNEMGEPANNVLVLNTKTKKKISLTEDFMLDADSDILDNLFYL